MIDNRYFLPIALSELLGLRHRAQSLGLTASRRTQAPLSGLYASVFRGQGMDFDEVREYQAGDEIRNLDWRVTARMGKPYLKVYREERERSVLLCVDVSANMQFGTRGTFKSVQAARLAALLGWSAQVHGDKVGGLLYGQVKPQFFAPQRAKRAFIRLLQHLTNVPIVGTQPDTDHLTQAFGSLNRSSATGALLFIISDFHLYPLDTLQAALSELQQRHEVVLIQVSDPADSHIPAMGIIRFQANDGTALTLNTDDAEGQYRYQQLWQIHHQTLQDMTRRLNIDWLTVTTQADAYQSLFSGLQQRLHNQYTHR